MTSHDLFGGQLASPDWALPVACRVCSIQAGSINALSWFRRRYAIQGMSQFGLKFHEMVGR